MKLKVIRELTTLLFVCSAAKICSFVPQDPAVQYSWIPIAIAGAAALANWLSNRKKARTSENEIDQTQTSESTGVTNIDFLEDLMPLLSGQQQGLQDSLISQIMNRINNPDNNVDNLITQGVFNINRGANLRKTAMARSLASRGLSRSPAAAAAVAGGEGDRISEIIQFRNQAPLIADQLARENLSLGRDIFSILPKGQRTTRTGTTTTRSTGTQRTIGTGTQVGAGSAAGSAVGGFAQALAFLYGQGAFNKP